MEKRFNKKYNSQYTQPDISYLPVEFQQAKVDTQISIVDLIQRCPHCLERYLNQLF